MFQSIKSRVIINRFVLGLTACAAISVNTFTATASDDVATEVDWGDCPCVQTGAAWNLVHEISSTSTVLPFVLQSIDQNQSEDYARSTNDLLVVSSGVEDLVGEIDIASIGTDKVLQCSAYTFVQGQGKTTMHEVADKFQVIDDCRSGLYKLVNQHNPISGNL